MSTLALSAPYRATTLRAAFSGIARGRWLIAGFAIGLPLFFYLLMLAVLVFRYDGFPNYVTPYNWPANVWRIIEGTKSVADMIPIIADEWLIEIGYKNYVYGYGVADWSLSLVPHKLILLTLTGALVGLNLALLIEPQSGSPLRQAVTACAVGLLTSSGAAAAGLTSVTLFSASHCATPSWVGGLAILGFESYDIFAVEPYGPLICAAGLATLIGSALLSSRRRVNPC